MVRVTLNGELAADAPQREMVHQFMDALVRAGEPVIDGGDRLHDLARDAGFLVHLSDGRLLGRLALLDMPLGQTPFRGCCANAGR